MDPYGPTARRFPLVARPRPACRPLPERIAGLARLARTAADGADPGKASAVQNLAALLASDVGLPELARQLCHQHATAYLNACPLPSKTAIYALEPIVNLARMQIRAGHPTDGHQRLLDLYKAVSTGTAGRSDDDITVPAQLTTTSSDRREVRAWLWKVVLADGTRALTTAGRWADALAHLKTYRGIGARMLDGRQVAIVAALTSGNATTAERLLAETTPGEPWEAAVTACLLVFCQRGVQQPVSQQHLSELAKTVLNEPAHPGRAVFHARLTLSVLDAIGANSPIACWLVNDLYQRVTASSDGYAARECLAHDLFTTITTESQDRDLTNIIDACALGVGAIPTDLNSALTAATTLSRSVIQTGLDAKGATAC